MPRPQPGETTFDGVFIDNEPPLTDGMQLLMSLAQSISIARRREWWLSRGFNDWPVDVVEPAGVREQVADLIGDMLVPRGTELAVENYYGTRLYLTPYGNAHLSRITIGMQSLAVQQQRVISGQDAEALIGINGIAIEPGDEGLVRVTWEDKRFSPHGWLGHMALTFWHEEDPREWWHEPIELGERIELSGTDSMRAESPVLVRKVGAPEWGGSGTEVFTIPGIEPRAATEEQAIGLLTIMRQMLPEYWLRSDR